MRLDSTSVIALALSYLRVLAAQAGQQRLEVSDDGDVDLADLAALLALYGTSCA